MRKKDLELGEAGSAIIKERRPAKSEPALANNGHVPSSNRLDILSGFPGLPQISELKGVAEVLSVAAEITGMRYVVVARVTPNSWTACAVLDKMGFGLGVGGQLDVNTTLCREVTDRLEPIVIEHAAADTDYCNHPTPKKYGIESYIAVPVVLHGGRTFGTLCAIDTEPAHLKKGAVVPSFKLFAELIAVQIDREIGLLELKASDERYRAFIANSSEGIWRFELDEPIPTDLPVDDQVRLAFERGSLAECNDAMARQYGFAKADDVVGARLTEMLVADDPKNAEFIRAFIESGYHLTDAESHERNAAGEDVYFINNLVGVVEQGRLVRAWGSQRDVTADRAEAKATAHLASIVESSDDAIISKDLNGVLTTWNAAAERMFGYTAAEAIGNHVTMLIPEPLRSEEDYIIGNIRRGIKIDHFETVRRRKDGTEFPVSLTVSPIRGPDGQTIGASKIARDISPQHSASKAMARLAAIVESSDDAIISKDLNGVLTSWNAAAERLFGFTAEEAIGKHVTILIPDRLHPEEDDIIGRVRRGIKVEHFETIRRKKDGTEFPVALTVSPMRDADGNVIGASKIVRDITESRQAKLISERYQLLSMRATDIILFIHPETGRIVDANEAAYAAYGYGRDELQGMRVHDLRAPETLNVIEQQYREANEHGLKFETVHMRKDGRRFPVDVSSIGADVGDERLIVSIIRDITERKENEDALAHNQILLSMALRGSRTGVWERDIGGDTVWWSPELEEIFGLKPGEFRGNEEHFYSLMHEDDREDVWSEVGTAVIDHRPYVVEFRFYHADGSVRWMEGRGEAVYSSAGEPVRIYGTGTDVTDRKQRELGMEFLAEVSADLSI